MKITSLKITNLFALLLVLAISMLPTVTRAAEVVNNFNQGTITNSAVLIGNIFTVPGNSFIDNWNFAITPTEQFSAFASATDNLPAFEIGMGSFGAKLIGASQTWAATKVGNTIRFDPIILTPGNYTLQIFGTVTGTIGAAYAGTMSAFATPVPEVSTYLMLLLGLTMMMVMARRQKMHMKKMHMNKCRA